MDYFYLLTVLSGEQNEINNKSLAYRYSSDSDLEAGTLNDFIRPNINSSLVKVLPVRHV